MFTRLCRYQFLFEELVKREFKKKYKKTVLGVAWDLFIGHADLAGPKAGLYTIFWSEYCTLHDLHLLRKSDFLLFQRVHP